MFQQLLTNRITPSQMDFIAQLEDDDGYMSINQSIFLFKLVKKFQLNFYLIKDYINLISHCTHCRRRHEDDASRTAFGDDGYVRPPIQQVRNIWYLDFFPCSVSLVKIRCHNTLILNNQEPLGLGDEGRVEEAPTEHTLPNNLLNQVVSELKV